MCLLTQFENNSKTRKVILSTSIKETGNIKQIALGFGYSFLPRAWGKNWKRFVYLVDHSLNDLIQGTQTKTKKYATKYTVHVFQGNFGIEVLTIKWSIRHSSLFKKKYTKVHTELHCIHSLQTVNVSNQTLHDWSDAVVWLTNLKTSSGAGWKSSAKRVIFLKFIPITVSVGWILVCQITVWPHRMKIPSRATTPVHHRSSECVAMFSHLP